MISTFQLTPLFPVQQEDLTGGPRDEFGEAPSKAWVTEMFFSVIRNLEAGRASRILDANSFSSSVLERAETLALEVGFKKEDFLVKEISEKRELDHGHPNLFRSLFLGAPGRYSLLGIPISFKRPSDVSQNSFLYKIVFGNVIFPFLTGGYLHVAVHELGHALTHKLVGNEVLSMEIHVKQGALYGGQVIPVVRNTSTIATTATCAMGPIAGALLSGVQLASLAALKDRISIPVAAVLGVGPLLWMVGECHYALTSALAKDDGDYGLIAKISGPRHLAVASVVLASTCALGILGAVKLWNR